MTVADVADDDMKGIDLLTVREVSDLLRIHIRTVQRLSKGGKIRAIKIGSQWRYKRTDIEQYYSLGTDSPECRACPRINTNFEYKYYEN